MSDPYTGARAPADTYPPTPVQYAPAEEFAAATPAADSDASGGVKEQAKQAAGQSAHAAAHAAGDVKDTAKHQAQRVTAEAKTQARGVAGEVRDRVTGEARSQSDRLAGSIRGIADQLDDMRGDRQDTPAATVVSRVADGGRQMADYLDRNGPEGVLREVQDFARRRPGAFLATAVAAGFVIGRLGKSVMQADETAGKPAGDTYRSDTTVTASSVTPTTAVPVYTEPVHAEPAYTDPSVGYATDYPAGTEYASTGTGRPVVVDEEYPGGRR